MKKDLGKKTIMSVYPVLIIGTYDEFGNANAMNAAWGGQSDTNRIIIALSDHKTTDNLKINKEFSVSFGSVDNVIISDYFGVVSGRKEDKIKKSNVHVIKSKNINAPLFEEYKLTLECKMVSLENEVLVGEIVNVVADESILDSKGNVSISKLNPIIFDSSDLTYKKLGDVVGKAFKDGLSLK